MQLIFLALSSLLTLQSAQAQLVSNPMDGMTPSRVNYVASSVYRAWGLSVDKNSFRCGFTGAQPRAFGCEFSVSKVGTCTLTTWTGPASQIPQIPIYVTCPQGLERTFRQRPWTPRGRSATPTRDCGLEGCANAWGR